MRDLAIDVGWLALGAPGCPARTTTVFFAGGAMGLSRGGRLELH